MNVRGRWQVVNDRLFDRLARERVAKIDHGSHVLVIAWLDPETSGVGRVRAEGFRADDDSGRQLVEKLRWIDSGGRNLLCWDLGRACNFGRRAGRVVRRIT